jgi:hypothetical protein
MYQSIRMGKLLLIGVLSVACNSETTIPEPVALVGRKSVEINVTQDTEPLPIATLAVEAELVLVGRLDRLWSYRVQDQHDTYTDYQLTPKQVIVDRAGRLTASTPGTPLKLVVQLRGGELVVDGTPVKVTDSSLINWTQDADLLLFQ